MDTNKKIIREKVTLTLKDYIGKTFSRSQIVNLVVGRYPNTNKTSVIPSDYCYNRYNKGIVFDFHILEYCKWNNYKVLGENYPYNGDIVWNEKKMKSKDRVVGKWINGKPQFSKLKG